MKSSLGVRTGFVDLEFLTRQLNRINRHVSVILDVLSQIRTSVLRALALNLLKIAYINRRFALKMKMECLSSAKI